MLVYFFFFKRASIMVQESSLRVLGESWHCLEGQNCCWGPEPQCGGLYNLLECLGRVGRVHEGGLLMAQGLP